MAVLAAAQLLDELMGRHRNTNPNEKIRKPNWEDVEYCKYFMVKFCPHDLFVNTRADLGVCPKLHDDEVKELFEKAKSCYRKTQYIDEFLRFCGNMINDVERKIQKGKQRLELMNSKPDTQPMTQAQTEKNQEQVQMLSQKIASLVTEAEEAGTRGDVEQAQGLMKLCDRLKEEKEQLLKQQENSQWSMSAELAAAQEKQMEVCAVCGAFLIVGDAQQRIEDHLSGKQHVGYFKLREAYDEMVIARDKEIERQRETREDRDNKGRTRGGLGSDRRERDRTSKDKDKETKEKDGKDKEGEKEREKDRDRERERERDRERHRSSREERSSRQDERERERGKHRRDRRSPHERHRRSRDRH